MDKELTEMSMFELATQLNTIEQEITKLQILYNMTIQEIHNRNEKLQKDPNLQPKQLKLTK